MCEYAGPHDLVPGVFIHFLVQRCHVVDSAHYAGLKLVGTDCGQTGVEVDVDLGPKRGGGSHSLPMQELSVKAIYPMRKTKNPPVQVGFLGLFDQYACSNAKLTRRP